MVKQYDWPFDNFEKHVIKMLNTTKMPSSPTLSQHTPPPQSWFFLMRYHYHRASPSFTNNGQHPTGYDGPHPKLEADDLLYLPISVTAHGTACIVGTCKKYGKPYFLQLLVFGEILVVGHFSSSHPPNLDPRNPNSTIFLLNFFSFERYEETHLGFEFQAIFRPPPATIRQGELTIVSLSSIPQASFWDIICILFLNILKLANFELDLCYLLKFKILLNNFYDSFLCN